jgi:AmmeMemoRadiSam system protein A
VASSQFEVLDAKDRQALLRLARQALEARVQGAPPPRRESGGPLDQPFGAFVSIHRDGELRGCLGRLEVDRPLSHTVAELAAVVADSDPRFRPVSPDELPRIELEISVLTVEREVGSVEEIDVGRHGLIVERAGRRGLLLPQVAAEHGWDRETFLAHTCIKAGLAADAWRHGVRILVFEAQVFSERSSEGSR